ncbi:hypothetical protein EG329_011108 [Mollisiaceae sp. DMI_Dod_QoI]|nr:hypothetical protein EG329_011108 [Helotiales sp. DMI_Dod_QoI]
MATAAETFRAREVYKYYQPRNLKDSPDASEASSTHSRSSRTRNPTNFNTQQSFSDTALTAFAQLTALRLSAQRAIVSLIDHENEYFLAESTSTLSLIDDDSSAQNASLSISGARVPREASLCEQTLHLVPNQDTTAEMTPVFLVPDLLHDEKMNQLDCVKGAPYLRFYCGVALTNKQGINIGCVYVVDDRPRADFSLEQAQFLTRMAATVMDHLENIRAKEDVVRMTRMSQALHAFIEGEGSMDGDWQRLKRYNLPAGAGVGFAWESNNKDRVRGYINSTREQGAPVSARAVPNSGELEVPTHSGHSPLQHSSGSSDARFNFNNSPWSSTSEVPQIPTFKSVFEGFDEAAAKLTGGRDAEFANDGFENLLHATFSRASNLVREGMEVDGAVFFDAPFRFYQGRSTLETDPRRSQDKESGTSSESDAEDHADIDTDARPGPRPHVSHSDYYIKHPDVPRTGVPMGLKSDVLGFSTRGISSWDNHDMTTTTNFTAIDQSLLTSLVRRYPQGELFVFDGNGPISPPSLSPDSSQMTITSPLLVDKLARQRARKRTEILRLLVAFPGARQIFFVPLYDSTSGCFIGSFTWSTSRTRIFSAENHLSYLIAFGHSVMSEVSRLNTLSADRAKGDFISNVSHELRSPLHGILASVEFLADTPLDGFQRNLIDTVDICGRTLLDTIEHVLDFSKIKKFGHQSSQPMGIVANLNVSAVIEEVLEGVFAGFEFNGLSSQGLADTTQSRTRLVQEIPEITKTTQAVDGLQPSHANNQLTVILDIDYRDQWKFPTVPGTWRRLAMNLFGNSLKYTPDGYIMVKLEARSVFDSTPNLKNRDAETTLVTLTITDSGRGMTQEFLKTKLFIPFSQEDVTAPGTGLGMSMVKQIVDLSGGTIDVHSELGSGTEIKLSLPLQNRLRDSDTLLGNVDPLYLDEDSIHAIRRRAYGRTVTISGFDNTSGKSKLQTAALQIFKASIQKYVTEWFGLTIVSSNEVVDIAILDESAFMGAAEIFRSKPKMLLILCSNGARRDIYAKHSGLAQHVEFVSKPCGPHRLTKALLNCLDKEDASEKANAARSSIGFSPTTTNLDRLPILQPKGQAIPIRRPPFMSRMSSENRKLKSESTTESSITSESSSTSATSRSSSGLPKKVGSDAKLNLDPKPTVSRPLKMLLVEDNPVNMMLLAAYMKKNKWEYETAVNGLLALQAFQNRPQGFDVIFMDVSMPIMTGYESTRAIRNVETERRLAEDLRLEIQTPARISPTAHRETPFFPFPSPGGSFSKSQTFDFEPKVPTPYYIRPALIIALTGFSSQQDQETAFESGVDVFMTKPVRFREVGRILDGWMKSREREDQAANDLLAHGENEKRELDEGMTGAKRSGSRIPSRIDENTMVGKFTIPARMGNLDVVTLRDMNYPPVNVFEEDFATDMDMKDWNDWMQCEANNTAHQESPITNRRESIESTESWLESTSANMERVEKEAIFTPFLNNNEFSFEDAMLDMDAPAQPPPYFRRPAEPNSGLSISTSTSPSSSKNIRTPQPHHNYHTFSSLTAAEEKRLNDIAMPYQTNIQKPSSNEPSSPTHSYSSPALSPSPEPPTTTTRSRKNKKRKPSLEDDLDVRSALCQSRKSGHNAIEKRYRTNLNEKIDCLRQCVPAFPRRLSEESNPDGAGGEDEDEEDMEGEDSKIRRQKYGKAAILTRALAYIKHLENTTQKLGGEVDLFQTSGTEI